MAKTVMLKARHANADLQIVNVLWPEMYAGTANLFDNTRVGHIPGSVNVPIERFFADEDVQTIKPAHELQSVLVEADLSPEQETVIHCQAGVRTTMGVFVTTLLGWERVRTYEASMAEWATQDDTRRHAIDYQLSVQDGWAEAPRAHCADAKLSLRQEHSRRLSTYVRCVSR